MTAEEKGKDMSIARKIKSLREEKNYFKLKCWKGEGGEGEIIQRRERSEWGTCARLQSGGAVAHVSKKIQPGGSQGTGRGRRAMSLVHKS